MEYYLKADVIHLESAGGYRDITVRGHKLSLSVPWRQSSLLATTVCSPRPEINLLL